MPNKKSNKKAKPIRPDQRLRFSMALPYNPRRASSIRSFTQIQQTCSDILHVKPTGPDQPLKFPLKSSMQPTGPDQPLRSSMVHLVPKPSLPSPQFARQGGPRGNRSPTVTKLPPVTWPRKRLRAASRFLA